MQPQGIYEGWNVENTDHHRTLLADYTGFTNGMPRKLMDQ